jgi:hypothetical protein
MTFRYHTRLDTPHSVEFLWTSDQPDADTKNLPETDIHATGRNRTRNPSRRMATDLTLRQHGRWNRLMFIWRA